MKLGFIGSGSIAEIMIQKILAGGLATPEDLFILGRNQEKNENLRKKYNATLCDGMPELAEKAEFIFVCVRAEDAPGAAKALANCALRGKCVVSISAGIPISLYEHADGQTAVARALPNPPSRLGEGVIVLAFNAAVSAKQKKSLRNVFTAMGLCLETDETKIDAVTSLTGPAPLYLFFQNIVEAGVLLGIDYKTSVRMAYQTVKGCLRTWEENIDDIAGLITEAGTPGGISVEQIQYLDEHAFRGILKGCYRTGYLKSEAAGKRITEKIEK